MVAKYFVLVLLALGVAGIPSIEKRIGTIFKETATRISAEVFQSHDTLHQQGRDMLMDVAHKFRKIGEGLINGRINLASLDSRASDNQIDGLLREPQKTKFKEVFRNRLSILENLRSFNFFDSLFQNFEDAEKKLEIKEDFLRNLLTTKPPATTTESSGTFPPKIEKHSGSSVTPTAQEDSEDLSTPKFRDNIFELFYALKPEVLTATEENEPPESSNLEEVYRVLLNL